MAQTVTTNLAKGLFEVTASEFTTITGSGALAQLSADISGCKDSITVVVDIPAGTAGNYLFSCIDTDGRKKNILLTSGMLNVFEMTTKGYKKDDGTADFQITSSLGTGFDSLGIRVAVLKRVNVVNH